MKVERSIQIKISTTVTLMFVYIHDGRLRISQIFRYDKR